MQNLNQQVVDLGPTECHSVVVDRTVDLLAWVACPVVDDHSTSRPIAAAGEDSISATQKASSPSFSGKVAEEWEKTMIHLPIFIVPADPVGEAALLGKEMGMAKELVDLQHRR